MRISSFKRPIILHPGGLAATTPRLHFSLMTKIFGVQDQSETTTYDQTMFSRRKLTEKVEREREREKVTKNSQNTDYLKYHLINS